MANKLFIDKNINVFGDAEAEVLLRTQNDKKYFTPGAGVVKVDESRWKEAQDYERKTWCDSAGMNCREDRNQEHKTNFDNYRILNEVLKNEIDIIELGCGPFTNLTMIIPILKKTISSIDLLDPLLHDYVLSSPNCTYKTGFLNFQKVTTITSSIEKFNSSKKYDLVVMINVLEHCFDIDAIFDNVKKMLKPEGVFVFCDKYRNEEDLTESLDTLYDAGHPIRITGEYLAKKLENFEVLYDKEFSSDFQTITKYSILRYDGKD